MTGASGEATAAGEVSALPAPPSQGGLDGAHTGRVEALDILRGVALVAMAAYHCTWDLGFLQLTPENLAMAPGGRLAARMIAGTFLFIVGFSLVLAHARRMRWRAFLHRLGLVSGAAAAITVATYFAFPDSFIFFGILHHIAVASVLALPFLRAPLLFVLAAAGLALAAPSLIGGRAFDSPPLAFLGLGTVTPVTNDYVPVFPWVGLVLGGVVAARVLLLRLGKSSFASWRAQGRAARALAWAGRHSLLVYLVHQPLLLAVLYPVALVLGPHPQAGIASFQREFEQGCTRRGERPGVCRAAASCVVEELKTAQLWAATVQNRLSPEEQTRAQALARECFERASEERP